MALVFTLASIMHATGKCVVILWINACQDRVGRVRSHFSRQMDAIRRIERPVRTGSMYMLMYTRSIGRFIQLCTECVRSRGKRFGGNAIVVADWSVRAVARGGELFEVQWLAEEGSGVDLLVRACDRLFQLRFGGAFCCSRDRRTAGRCHHDVVDRLT